jgi:hypothetical protein
MGSGYGGVGGGGGGGGGSGDLLAANNLSDLASTSVGLTNLGALAASNNLSDLASVSVALSSLGMTGARTPISPGAPIFDFDPAVSKYGSQGSASLTSTQVNNPTIGDSSTGKGLPAYQGDGAARAIHYGTTMSTPASWTLFAVVSSDVTNDYICAAADAAGANDDSWGGLHRVNSSNKLRAQCGDGTNAIVSDTDTFTFSNGVIYVITAKYTSGDNFVEIWVDGVSEAATTTGSATSCSGGPWQFAIGRFGAYNAGAHWDGNIYRVVAYDSALGDADRAAFETALMGYYQ